MLTVAGLHVPVTPLVEVLGSEGTVVPLQVVSVLLNEKVGFVFCVTFTVRVKGLAH